MCGSERRWAAAAQKVRSSTRGRGLSPAVGQLIFLLTDHIDATGAVRRSDIIEQRYRLAGQSSQQKLKIRPLDAKKLPLG
jgi:hypothetical protein